MGKAADHKSRQTLKVVESCPLAEGVWSLTLEYAQGSAPTQVRPGQFVGVFTKDASALLMRPISICEWDMEKRRLRLVYRVVGKGTRAFACLRAGETVDVLGILGNGYDLTVLAGKHVLLLGGGIGAPPMLGLAQALKSWNAAWKEPLFEPDGAGDRDTLGVGRDSFPVAAGTHFVTSVMGYRTDDLFLTREFSEAGRLLIATDDGTAGFHGNAVDAARALAQEGAVFDVICACGPLPMLRSVKTLAGEWGIPAFISLEERMACGIGACLGCVTKTTQIDGHSHVCNARVCTEGPVFAAEDVIL